MGGQWRDVVRLEFKGPRFRDHALDLYALAELSHFQKIMAETAKELWRAAHPDRSRLPRYFEERTRLCLRRVDKGSAVVPLEVRTEEPDQKELFQEPCELDDAITLAEEVFEAVERDAPLPERFPKDLMSEYIKWGETLADDESIEFGAPGRKAARVTAEHRVRLERFLETPHEDHVDLVGEVFEADVRQRRFHLWIDDRAAVSITFSEEQESLVTHALKEHKSLRMQVKGLGVVSPLGKVHRVKQVDKMEIRAVDEVLFDPSARPIEDVLAELAKEVPESEWRKLPRDLSENLDHHIYGTLEEREKSSPIPATG